MNTPLFPNLTVNGRSIPSADIAAEAQNHHAPKGKPGIAWRKAARALAIRELLLQEADARNLIAVPEEVAPGRFETREDALVRALLEQAVEVAQPTEAEVQAEWAKDPARFRSQPLWEVSHILCACDPGEHPTATAAHARATALTVLVRDNPRGFGAVAARESDCGSKDNGGALGQLGPGDTVPEFEAVLRDLSEGGITERPVRTRFGWHVIRLDAVAEGQVLPYGAVQAKLSEAMEKAAWASAARRFVQRLADASEIAGTDV